MGYVKTETKRPQQASGLNFYRKYRHMIFAAVGWVVFFILFFRLKAVIEPKYYIHCRLDDYIPFIKWFFIPYCIWFVYVFAILFSFGVYSKPDFKRAQTYVFLGFAICLAVHVMYPNAIDFRPVVTETDFISRMMASLYSMESSTMVVPSMHVFGAVALHISLVKSRLTGSNKRLITLSFLLVVLICASTVFVKQHSIIDVFWGVALAIALYFPVYRFKVEKSANSASQ